MVYIFYSFYTIRLYTDPHVEEDNMSILLPVSYSNGSIIRDTKFG